MRGDKTKSDLIETSQVYIIHIIVDYMLNICRLVENRDIKNKFVMW